MRRHACIFKRCSQNPAKQFWLGARPQTVEPCGKVAQQRQEGMFRCIKKIPPKLARPLDGTDNPIIGWPYAITSSVFSGLDQISRARLAGIGVDNVGFTLASACSPWACFRAGSARSRSMESCFYIRNNYMIHVYADDEKFKVYVFSVI